MAVNTRPGIGKTEIVQAVADATGTTLFDLRLTMIAPQDLRRLPTCVHATRRTVWYRPEDLPDDPAAPVDPVSGRTDLRVPMLHPTVYGLLQECRVGRHRLPDTTDIVAAGNGV